MMSLKLTYGSDSSKSGGLVRSPHINNNNNNNHNDVPITSHQLRFGLALNNGYDPDVAREFLCDINLSHALVTDSVSEDLLAKMFNFCMPDLECAFTQIAGSPILDINNEMECEGDPEIFSCEQIILNGETRVRIRFGEQHMLLDLPTTLQDFQNCIAESMRNWEEVDFTEITRANIRRQEKAVGGRLSDVSKFTYKNEDVWFYKPIRDYHKGGYTISDVIGVPRVNNRFAQRSIFTYKMSRILDFPVIPVTVFSTDYRGKEGYIQKKAHGVPALDCLDELYYANSLHTIWGRTGIVRQFIQLQLLHALLGQGDFNPGNCFIDLNTNSVTGIDNDNCLGYLTTHPNLVIPRSREDGFLPDKEWEYDQLTEHEKEVAEHIEKNLHKKRSDVYRISHAGRGVFLPPVIDTDMVEKFKNLSEQDLLRHMEGFEFTDKEQAAAASRLNAIKSHIDVLEQRQEIGVLSIIDPKDWGRPEVTARLHPHPKHVGNALIACTSYLQLFVYHASGGFSAYEAPAWGDAAVRKRNQGYKDYAAFQRANEELRQQAYKEYEASQRANEELRQQKLIQAAHNLAEQAQKRSLETFFKERTTRNRILDIYKRFG